MNLAKCPAHAAILEEAKRQIARHGKYEHDKVLRATKYEAIEESVQWAYIRKRLEEENEESMVPCARRWFHPGLREYNPQGAPQYNQTVNPDKFVAVGNGKRAAGYALANKVPPAMAKYWLEWKASAETGAQRSHQTFRAACEKRGLLSLVTKQITAEQKPPEEEAA